MALDEYRKARLRTALITVASITVVGSIAWGLYQMSLPVEAAREPIQMQISQPIYEAPPPEPEKPPLVVGSLTTSRDRILMGDVVIGESSYSGSLTITAVDRPVTIKSVAIAFAQEVGIKLDAKNCIDSTLQPDQNCTVDILFDPLNPVKVEKQIIIQAESDNSDGSKKVFSKEITLSGSATKPTPAPVAVAAASPQTTEPTVIEAPNPALTVYLQNRRQLGVLSAEDSEIGPQLPRSDDWSSIGYETNMSTFPVDMRRVVTMDKPIPAVIKIGIDTRYASRAVAQVERDIYGGEGTLVLIPRGSTVVGTVSAVSSAAEEKVVITWERIVRPDGAAFKFEGYAGDAMGRSGVIGHIDNRYIERYGNTVLASIINVGVTLGLNGKQQVQSGGWGVGSGYGYGYNNQPTTVAENARSVATKQFREDFEKIIDDIQSQGSQIPPIRTIPAGTRITIFPNQDLWLRPIVPTETMKAQLRQQRSWSVSSTSDQTDAINRSAASTTQLSVSTQYDPVTGRPLRQSTPPPAPAMPNLDARGFPILPGNLGLQAPSTQSQPQQSSTTGVVPPTSLPTTARPSQAPALNGQDASASSQIKSRETSGSSPWTSIR